MSSSSRFLAPLSSSLSLLLLLLLISLSNAQQPAVCNGNSLLCSRPYSAVSYVTAHNAYAVGNFPAANQKNTVKHQLNDGVRAFMLDIMDPSATNATQIQLCHTDCALLNAGSLVNTLSIIADFMAKNPAEVITIFFENVGKITPDRITAAFTQADILKYAYVPPSPTTWSTLGDMIISNKKLVVFTDTEFDATVAPWLLYEYTYVWETPFSVQNGADFSCSVDRPKDDPKTLYVMNHFIHGLINLGSMSVEVPVPDLAITVNTEASLTSQSQMCEAAGHSAPNYVAVDFYQTGDVLKYVADLNQVPYVPPPAFVDPDALPAVKSDGVRSVSTVGFATTSRISATTIVSSMAAFLIAVGYFC